MQSAKRAFTLIELLVVVAIIALLISILLPALSTARHASRLGVSLANLRQLGAVQFAYAGENRDSFVNPFDPKGTLSYDPINRNWTVLRWFAYESMPGRALWQEPSDSARTTEAYAFHWTSPIWNYIAGDFSTAWPLTVAPCDGPLQNRIRLLKAEWAQRFSSNQFSYADRDLIIANVADTSYWYPPVFWLTPDRYQTSSLVPIDSSDPSARFLRRNRISDVVSPQAKVMLFERMDFTRNKRPTPSGSASYPPNWNNPKATARVAVADGSVTSAKMETIYTLAGSSDQATRDTFTPSGNWNMTTDLDQGTFQYAGTIFGSAAKGELENGQHGTTAYPAHFWATRMGIKGRDLNR